MVEDVHWADTSTRELLALLTRQQQGDVVLLLTLRTDESPTPAGLTRYLAELVRRGDHRVALQPLSREQQAHQISDILGVPPHRQLLDEVYERAEGNPFFAEEVLALVQHGDEGLPATVRDLLVARLEALSPATQQVLRTASVIGRTAPYRLLEAVVDVSGERLEEVLRHAVTAHVLRAEGDGLTFRHALLQEAVAASLLPGEAARTHRRIAEALTEHPELAGQGALVAGRLARHWAEAGDQAQALSASVAAALEACDALAFAESLSHYERALELVEVVPDAEALLDLPRARLLYWAAEVAHLAAHPDRATELVREAIARVDPDDLHLNGWLHERLGRYLWMSADTRNALASYQRAVELVPAEPPTRGRAAVLSGLSQMLMLTDRHAESEVLAREAIAVAALVPDARSVEGHARCNLGVDLAYLGRLDEGIAELREARRIAEEQFDDVDDIARAMVNLVSALYDHGRLAEAADIGLESVRVTETLGLQRRKGVWSRCDAAQVLLLLGRWDEAGQLLDEARELQPQGIDAFRTDQVEGQLWLRRGDLGRARTLMERAEQAAVRIIDPHLLAPLYATLVEIATWQGDDVAAARWSADGLRRLDHVRAPRPRRARPCRRRDRGRPGRSAAAGGRPGPAGSGRGPFGGHPGGWDPGGDRGTHGPSRAVRRRNLLAGRGRGVGGPGRAVPVGVRARAGGAGAAGHGGRPRGGGRAPAHRHRNRAADRCRRGGRASRGPRAARSPARRGGPGEPVPAHRPRDRGAAARRRRPQRPRDRRPAVHQPPHRRAARLEPAGQARCGAPRGAGRHGAARATPQPGRFVCGLT